jgi:hypothetical protein
MRYRMRKIVLYAIMSMYMDTIALCLNNTAQIASPAPPVWRQGKVRRNRMSEIKKCFTISKNDAGSEAYRDEYVQQLERELASANARVKELDLANKRRVIDAILRICPACGDDMCGDAHDVCYRCMIADKDKQIAELQGQVEGMTKRELDIKHKVFVMFDELFDYLLKTNPNLAKDIKALRVMMMEAK